MPSDSLTPIYDDSTLEQLQDLIDEGDSSFLSELFESYLETAEENLTTLKTDEDRDVQCRAAHTLKGSSLNVGAACVANICKDLELELREAPVADLHSRIARIESQLSRVKESYPTTIERLASTAC